MRRQFHFTLICCSLFLFSRFVFPQTIPYDTVSIEYTSDDIRYLHLKTELPQQIHVAVIPLRTHSLSIEAVRHNGLITTSHVVAERKKRNETVVAAVNGDFFSFTDSMPVNNQSVNGHPVTGFTTPRKSALAVLNDGSLLLDGFTFSGAITTRTQKIFPFFRLNRGRTRSEITLYNRYFGERTRTDSGGVEIVLHPVEIHRAEESPKRFRVAHADTAVNSSIPKDGVVISFGRSDSAARFLAEFNEGDTVTVEMMYLPVHDHLDSPVRHLLSGWGRLTYNGINLPAIADTNEGLTAKFTAVRHPRTFVGFNADTSLLYLGVVDGRQEQSVGMTFLELSDFLLTFGVTNAINLDGGGSSTLVFNGRVVNSPSDKTGERPVANSIHVVRTSQEQ